MSKFTPKTRLEKFLAKIAGHSEEELEPKTRLEAALDDIAENIGSGSGGDSGLVLDLRNANSVPVSELLDVIVVDALGSNNFRYMFKGLENNIVPINVIFVDMTKPLPLAYIDKLRKGSDLYAPFLLNHINTEDATVYPYIPDDSADSSSVHCHTFKDPVHVIEFEDYPFILIEPFELVETYYNRTNQ